MKIFVCYNAVSYSIAHALAKGGFSIIIYDQFRIIKKPTIHAYQIGFGPAADRLLERLISFKLVNTVYLPHHINPPMVKAATQAARFVNYIDDGLDTLRNAPKNFNLDSYSPDSALYTFFEYEKLGRWLEGRKVSRVASFRDFPDYEFMRSKLISVAGATVVIESAGLTNVDLGELGPTAMIFGHPNPAKNNPRRARFVIKEKFNLEKSLSREPAKRIFVGESISLIYLLHFDPFPQTEIYVYLEDPDNLSSISKLLASRPNVTLMDAAFFDVNTQFKQQTRD